MTDPTTPGEPPVPGSTPHARLKQALGDHAPSRPSGVNLGLIGSAMCGVFTLLGIAPGIGGGRMLSLVMVVSLGLAGAGWLHISKRGHRIARVAALGLAIHAVAWLLSILGFWSIAIVAIGFGQLIHFLAAGLYGVHSIRSSPDHALSRRIAAALHFVAAALVTLMQMVVHGVLQFDFGLWQALTFVVASAHFAAIVFFLPAAARSLRPQA